MYNNSKVTFIDDFDPGMGYGEMVYTWWANYSQDIIIGDHVWIGYRAILTKGCKICNNSIIAVGAVCNRSLNKAQSDGCVIGGNPAKVIARDKNWTRNRKDGEK